MRGYVGEKARRRKRRVLFIIFFVIIFLTIIYFSYNVEDKKKGINDEITSTDDTIYAEQSRADKEGLELKIIEKEQKIIFRDKLIESLKKQINVLKEEKNHLSEKNKKLLVSLDTLNSEIEKNSQIQEDIVKEKIKESNSLFLQLKKENEKILNEYENVVKKNLELDLQLQSLNMEIPSLNIEIKSLNIENRKKILQLEQLINDQKKIIESLKVKAPH